MTFIIFMTFGAVIGWLLSQKHHGTSYGPVTDLAVGAIGGLIGGWAATEIGIAGVSGFLVALIAAMAVAAGLVKAVRAVAPATGVVAG